ncbi:hypothetical protein B0H13DRAFT_117368 [Mycena leptocephala]|nr:hypothetical protein B0H13DRAFT_117368 [Mycena leptocephala]
MAETTPAPVERSTTRSSAIHSSADLLCKLIGDEVSYAIKPYQDAVLVLQRQLQALSNANPSVYPGAAVILAQSAERSETELSALKAALEECGFGLTLAQDSGKPSLRFVGASATFVSILSAELKAFAPNPEVVQPITPASIVRVLVQGFSDCKRRLDEAHRRYSNSFRERDELKKTLAAAAAREAGDATKWTAERATLEATVREEENKVAALTKAVGLLRSQLQAMAARNNEAADWKDKYQAVEAEREELKNTAYTSQGMLVSLEADLNTWKTKCEKVEADLASAKDESEDNLRKVQAEVNEWKTKFQGVETELKTVTDESDAKLRRAQVDLKLAQDKNEEDLEAKLTTATNQSNATLRTTQAELDDWKDKCLALEAELKTEAEKMRVDLETVQSEMETWKTRSLAAEVERDSAQTVLRDATAQIPSDADTAKTDLAAWEAKAAAWDAERKRHKNQTARNAALISQFQVDVPKLENNVLTAELEELKKISRYALPSRKSLHRKPPHPAHPHVSPRPPSPRQLLSALSAANHSAPRPRPQVPLVPLLPNALQTKSLDWAPSWAFMAALPCAGTLLRVPPL